MHQLDGRLVLSATDLNSYLECGYLTHVDLAVAKGELEIEPVRSAVANLLGSKGDEHEVAYLESLKEQGKQIRVIETNGDPAKLREATAETAEAMRSGVEVIYQATFFNDDSDGDTGFAWRGHADFLERVDTPSTLGDWSYEVVDTKLAKRTKPYFLLQLCFYSELLVQIQEVLPEQMHVVLGTRERESFRLAEFMAYYRRLKQRFVEAVAAGVPDVYPYPVERCGFCSWSEHCDQRWLDDDHLSLVAGIRRDHTVRLADAGVATTKALGEAKPAQRPPRIPSGTFHNLSRQAHLQTEQRETGKHLVELLEPEDERGLALLPEPSDGDLFFDMEGDPFFEGRLEYLFGVTSLEHGEPSYRAFWGRDRGEEKRAFEQFMDFVGERRRRDPDLHIYHYAHYEVTALKRLAGQHGTREEELDELLRKGVFADLYRVVRQALRISQPSYSIKKVEVFYMREREASVTDGEDSTVIFEQWLETGDDALLEGIERYNEEDCQSTHLLSGWLLEQRTVAEAQFDTEIAWRAPPEERESTEDAKEISAELVTLLDGLLDGLPDDPEDRTQEQQSRWLMAQLLEYHRREDRPVWWAYFARLEATEEELIEQDSEALGGLGDAGVDPRPLPPPKRSTIHTLVFPPQDHRIEPGDADDPATQQTVKIVAIDNAAGVVEISRGTGRTEELPRALIPGGPYRRPEQRAALRRFAEDLVSRGLDAERPYRALRDLLQRELPRSTAIEPGTPLQGNEFDLEQAKRIVAGLDDSYLFIQGPPGSGKTYTAAQVILDLLEQGKRIGVAANSHKAIHNLLDEIEKFAPRNPDWRGLKKGAAETEFQSRRGDDPLIENSNNSADFVGDTHTLVAGTAWLFAPERMDEQLDYLFIDEAGQISLADALAMGTAARNVVLLGDPLQLAQVSQAAHPPGAGLSVLEHLLGEHGTVPPERGLFIDHTRRMHPDVCEFISEAVYEGRLHSIEGCATQRIDSSGELTATGVRWISVEHEGNVRESPEEADAIAAAIEGLEGATYTKADGSTVPLAQEEIMVVAPYNAQVRCLRERLPDGVQVGTVDKFQGQEAAVVFFSMATSSGAEIPRNIEFLFSRNRLNVAISRARCLAVLVASPGLLYTRCRSAEQMRLVNALCRLVEVAEASAFWEDRANGS